MKMPPEVLRLSGDFSATMAYDYDFQKMAIDYATLTRPGSPSPTLPGIPAPALLPILAQIGVVCHGQPPLTPWPYAATAPPRCPGRHKPRTWCSLPRLENGLYRALTALAISVLYAAYTVTALASPHKPTI